MATTTDPETATLKAKRAAAKTPQPTLPPDADVPPAVGQNEPARRFPLLGDPREPLVLGASGMTLGGDHGDKYVRAEVAGYEQIVPRGCTTPVTRKRWAQGQWVLRTVYERYVADQQAAAKGANAG